MTVLEVIQRSAQFLAKRGVDSPRLQSELLTAHVLGIPRLNLYLDFERTLTADETGALRDLVKQRGERKPLQHILGSTSFCGLEIKVTPAVLIPRPETEILAEKAWRFLRNYAESPRVLDFGTGSGCLAIAIAIHAPLARISALDQDRKALEIAKQNAVRHGLDERIDFFPGDGFQALPAGMTFDLIVSNPPYIPSGQIAQLQPEVRDHEPRAALDGGPDGLNFFRELARGGGHFLAAAGRLMAEFGDGQAPAICEILAGSNWVVEGVEKDYIGRPRIFTARKAV